MKKLRVTVEGKVYEVTVEEVNEGGASEAVPVPGSVGPSSVSAPASSAKTSSPASAGAPGAVVSPLAGKVVEVKVKEGQTVREGDELVVLEAMKMNTFVYAPSSATVAKVLVAAGDAVEENQVLVQLT